MEDVNEGKEVKEIEPLEALEQLKKLFDSIPNPFQGTRAECKIQNDQVDFIFEIIKKAL